MTLAPPAPLAPLVPAAPVLPAAPVPASLLVLLELQAPEAAPTPISVNVRVTKSFRVIRVDFMFIGLQRRVLRGASEDNGDGIRDRKAPNEKSAMDLTQGSPR